MKSLKPKSTILMLTLCSSMAIPQAHAQQPAVSSNTDRSADTVSRANSSPVLAEVRRGRRTGFSLMPSNRYAGGIIEIAPVVMASPPAVLGTGTVGNISMFAGTNPAGNSILGDSIIFQSNDKIGIGLAAPTSKLTVQGMIETTLGGYKFPDGTVQTTAAVSGLTSIIHDASLRGNGTSGSPLGIAVPLSLTANATGPFGVVVDVANTSATGIGGTGMRVQGGGGTFAGNGINVFGGKGVINGGRGVFASGGIGGLGGTGVETRGGSGGSGGGGRGLDAVGGNSDTGNGGTAVHAIGGESTNLFGGSGVFASGGDGDSFGGTGIVGLGGNAGHGSGGTGVFANGGLNSDPSSFGGVGLTARQGTGINGAPAGLAGEFQGNVVISGNLFATGTKNFMIDHPLDPENRYLYHAAIESSEVLNVYSGNVTTNGNGEAVVTLPDWFEALNKDFRYQLTPIGAPAQGLYIAEKMNKNRFTIAGGQPGMEVSWQVTGVRSDATMRKHAFTTEEDKPERERGFYLHPEAFNQPEEKGIDWARNPEMMQRLKETRLKTIEELKVKSRRK